MATPDNPAPPARPVDLRFAAPPAPDAALVFGADAAAPAPPANPVDLVFADPPANSADLVFGGSDTPPPADGAVELTLRALLPLAPQLPPLTAAVALRASTPVTIAAMLPSLAAPGAPGIALPALTASGTLAYDTQTDRPTVGRIPNRWQDAAAVPGGATPRHQDAGSLPAGWGAPWQPGASLPAGIQHRLPPVLQPESADRAARHKDAAGLRASARLAYQDADPRWLAARAVFENADGIRVSTQFRHQDADRTPRASRRTRWQPAAALGLLRRGGFQPADQHPIGWTARHQDAMRPPPGTHPPPVEPPETERCYTPSTDLVFLAPWSADTGLVFVCERGTTPPVAPPGQIVVQVRRVYFMLNEIQLHRIDGNVELRASAFTLALDSDSWTWTWSATLEAAAYDALQPARVGTPVAVEALINGVPYRLLVESVQLDRRFAETRVQVRGRGLAAALAAPYAPILNYDNAAGARSAQQLMFDVLTLNGVGIGWDVDWRLTDWQVPAGAWGYQGAYIDAINTVAAAAGGYVQPHATAQTLRILPRYPVAPWNWAGVDPDIVLPQDLVSVEGTAWATKPDYNRVFVSGADASGILGQITRTGTPGDIVAPMATDALITATEAAEQRGRAILGDTGAQAIVTLTLPVLPETGLILPGTFVRRTDGATALQGYVRSFSLAWDAPRMRQTIQVETHA